MAKRLQALIGNPEDNNNNPVLSSKESLEIMKMGDEMMNSLGGYGALMESMYTDLNGDFKKWDAEAALMFAYDGFQPVVFLTMLAGKAKKSGISSQDFQKDLMFLCRIILMRGSKINSIKKKLKVEGIAKFAELVKRYGIIETQKDKLAKDYTANDVTMGRIGASCPQVCAKILLDGNFMPVIIEPELPIMYHFNNGACLIPKNMTEVHKAWLRWARKQDMMLNKTDAADEERITKFYNIQVDSRAISETQKMKLYNGSSYVIQ